MSGTGFRSAMTVGLATVLASASLTFVVFAAPNDSYVPGSQDPLTGYRQLTLNDSGASEPGAHDPSPTDGASHEPAVEGASPPPSSTSTGVAATTTVSDVMPLDPSSPYVLGLTWPSGLELHIESRIMTEDVWGEWEEMGIELSEAGDIENTEAGTEPLIVGSAAAIQVRVTSSSATPEVTIHLISANATEPAAEVDPSGLLGSARFGLLGALPEAAPLPRVAVDNPQPTIRLRGEWGAAAPTGGLDPGDVRGAAIHHTAGTNNYSQSEVPGILRAIQVYHVSGRGWYDIGYNFLVDRFGRIWEGRAGGIETTWKGVHSHSFNGEVFGVSVMGNFQQVAVPAAVMDSLVKLIVWKFNLHGIDAAGVLLHKGTQVFPTILGHRDVPESSTACPGTYLYALLPTLRSRVIAAQHLPAYEFDADVTGDDRQDLLVLSGDTVHVFEEDLTGGVSEPVSLEGHLPYYGATEVGINVSAWPRIISSPNLTRGGTGTDLLGVHYRSGILWRLSENGTGTIRTQSSYGLGWRYMRSILAPGDFNGDGRADILAITERNGDLYFYAGRGDGRVASARKIGNGWNNMSHAATVGDLNGDGITDMLGVQARTGDLYFYPGTGRGTFNGYTRIGEGFSGFNEIAPVGDLTGDRVPDVILHNPETGETRTLVGSSTGILSGYLDWDGGWGNWRNPVGAPNWGRASGFTLLAVDSVTGELVRPVLNRDAPIPSTAVTPTFIDSGRAVTLPNLATAFVIGDLAGSSTSDIAAIDTQGDLYLFTATDTGFEAPTLIGSGMGAFTHVAAAGDSTFDGIPDLVVVDPRGNIAIIPVVLDPNLGLGTMTRIATGYAGQRVFGVGSWVQGDRADFIAVNDTTGNATLLRGHMRAGVTGAQVIATGWAGRAVSPLGSVAYAGGPTVVTFDPTTREAAFSWANTTGAIGGTGPLNISLSDGQHIGENDVEVLPPAFDIVPSDEVTSIQVDGLGYGHGIGMSQYGARGRASAGQTADQILTFYYPGTASGTTGNTLMRIWIRDAATDGVTLVAESGLTATVGTATTVLPVTEGGEAILEWRLQPTGAGTQQLLFRTGTTWEVDTVSGLDFSSSANVGIVAADGTVRVAYSSYYREYRGSATVLVDPASATTSRLIISTPIEEYLRGVVPREMPASWPTEGLRAQAIAARTYAQFDRTDGGPTWYDTCSTTACQVYSGIGDYYADGSLKAANTDSRTDAAVSATAGLIRTYSGSPAFTQFSASNGTQSAVGSRPYLVSKADPFDGYAPWTTVLAVSDVEAAYPAIGNLMRIRADRDGNGPFGGRVTSLTITGDAGSVDVSGSDFRFTFGLRSTLFEFTTSNGDLTGFISRDLNHDTESDIPLIHPDGTLRLFRGNGGQLFSSTAGTGSNLYRFERATLLYGFTGFERHTLVGIDGGTMTIFEMSTGGTVGATTVVAGDWSGYREITGIDAWNGAGTTGLLAIERATGDTYLFGADGDGGFNDPVLVTSAWALAEQILPAGDSNHDGHADVLTLDADMGELRLHLGDGTGRWEEGGTLLATDFGGYDGIISSADWNSDGKFDVAVRDRASGSLYIRLGTGSGTFGAPVYIRGGFQGYLFVN